MIQRDFISNAWIVNKFPDELKMLGLGSTITYVSTLSDMQFEYQYNDIIEGIEYNLERLNFYISALQDERIEVGLPLVDLDKK